MNPKVAKESRTAKDKAKGNLTPSSGGKGSAHKGTANGTGIRKAGSKSKLNDAVNGGEFGFKFFDLSVLTLLLAEI